MKILKFKLLIFTLITLILVQTSPAYAYVLESSSMRWGSNVHWDKDIYFYNSYQTQVDNAMYAWNITPTKALIWYDAGCLSDVSTQSLPNDTWYGLYQRRVGYYDITLNDYRLFQDYSGSGYDNAKQSTTVHEWGHALGLGDQPNGSTMIMGYGRDRTTMITPQQDDIDGVNAIYGAP